MPFPFDLAGPAFLAFYVAAAAVLLGAAALVIRQMEHGAGAPAGLLTDPYEIAYLRGGPAEAVKVATLSLIDRGAIRHEHDQNGAAVLSPVKKLRTKPSHPLEREVMARVDGPTNPESLTGGSVALAASRLVGPALAARGLLVDGPVWSRRVAILGGAWGVLSLLFVARLAQAMASQRGNVLFLILLWIGAGAAAVAIARYLPNAGAARALDALQTLLAGLRERAAQFRPGRATNELALLAAVFGFWAIPEALAPYAYDLSVAMTPKPPPSSGGDSGSGCGSGGGGGSGCGGGGGGCGGCGGG